MQRRPTLRPSASLASSESDVFIGRIKDASDLRADVWRLANPERGEVKLYDAETGGWLATVVAWSDE